MTLDIPPAEARPCVRLFVGDDLGYLKVVEAPTTVSGPEARLVARWGEASRATRSVTALHAADTDGGEPVLGVGRVSGMTETLDWNTGRAQRILGAPDPPGQADSPQPVAGVHLLPGGASAAGPAGALCLLSCARSGLVSLTAATDAGAPTERWQAKPEVLTTAVHAPRSLLALGCRGSEASVWDCAAGGTATWQGKGQKPDRVGLCARAHNTALAFVRGSGHELVVGTAKGRLCLYDTRAQRRPCLAVEQSGGAAVTCLAAPPASGEAAVWAANAKGDCWLWDLRAAAPAGGLRGCAGAVRGLALHPTAPLLAAVGLDRHARLFDTRARKPLAKLYLKQFLNRVTFAPGLHAPAPAPTAAAATAAAAAGTAVGLAGAGGGGGAGAQGRKRTRQLG